MGGIFVFEYSGPNPGGPYFLFSLRTGLITSPDFLEPSPAYRRLGEDLVRLQLTRRRRLSWR